ncbi:LPS export ABC transporter permease LptG [Rhodoblastus sphagnicola]|uniref:LPS export ABC transporter permease LptG n=1 Tax=Rhodoblastus sphagnicola TaxID=333368 RepID=A0A2S6NCY6_9HYPH|nr:LPS export ABC transporter permease LptG [Rhodoblastus sphagnicola]MBB4196331.1 lipopolysaccharide export system permease protein [Rhodoblastus sphagnicola]PPQ32469.1 LPS export ABC transporter permease LptG [Rhodoblastus sphagnicola]
MIGRTLGIYFALRFLQSLTVIFFTIFGLIYMADFVEMLRRAGDVPNTPIVIVLLVCLMRTPSIAEQVLPFATLFGAMAAFISLTRKLELVVARAAGVSVWQFLAPPVIAALGLGVVVVTLLSPGAALMKKEADIIEAGIFKTQLSAQDSNLWIRQRGRDQQSILRADLAVDSGLRLSGVTVYVFDLKGRFVERVDAAEGRLLPGEWELKSALVTAPAVDPRQMEIYHLGTNLLPAQVAQSFVAPETVPFWSLPRLAEDTESVGLDSVGYRLRFQQLLALPTLLAAMVLIAACFSLKLSRMGGVGLMVLGGVGSGFVLYVASKLISDLGGAGMLSAPVAAWSPAIVANLLGGLTLLNREDG